jgi:hypothetical protein
MEGGVAALLVVAGGLRALQTASLMEEIFSVESHEKKAACR